MRVRSATGTCRRRRAHWRRVEAVDVRVQRVERVGVPQREHELADDLVHVLRAEAAREPGRADREQVPAQRVGALLVEHAPGVDHVAQPLGHLAAVAVQDVAQAEHVLVAGVAGEQRADGQQAVEPAAGLVDGLADEIGREALLERLLVLEGVVPLGDGHGAGVEPGVDDRGARGWRSAPHSGQAKVTSST